MHQNEHSAIRDVAKPSRLRFVVGTLLFGSILIILTCYWIISAENRVVWELTDFSIFPTVLFTFFLLAAITPILRKYLKNIAPTSSELAMTYIMVSVATALAGHDIVRQLVPMIANAGWFATPENEWSDIFFRFLPTWLTITDRKILQGYFEADDTFWRPIYMEAWFVPIVAWSALVIVLMFMMLCINIIIRKQWIDHEKLSYPLTTLPVELLGNTSSLLRNKLIWLGFGIAFGLEILAGLNYLFPVIPSLKIKYQLFFADRPWNAIGRLPVYVYPFAIGLGFLMPLDLAMSFWAFYLFWGLQRVFFTATGWTTAIGFQTEQRAGAWIGIGLLALLTSRKEIQKVLGGVFSFKSKDPLYRLAVFGLLFGLAFVLIFWYYAGLSPWVALGYFGIYLVLCIGMTRMRAELGPPTHELHRVHPDRILLLFLGSRPLGAQNLTNTTLLSWLAYGYRCHPMPHQLEAFKIGRHFRLRENRLVVALIVASIVGAVISIVGHVALYYEFRFARWGVGEFNRLQNWITSPRAPNLSAIQYMGFGFVLTVILTILKRQFLWWPFYPVGYAVGNGWAIGWMWFSIFLGWLFKRITFTGGGVRAYRKVLPLFLGLIFGQFLAGSLWSLLGVLFNRNMYTLFP